MEEQQIFDLYREIITRLKKFNQYRCGEGTFEELGFTARQITHDIAFLCDSYEAMQNSVIEVMIRFPNVAEYIKQLEERLANAEATKP